MVPLATDDPCADHHNDITVINGMLMSLSRRSAAHTTIRIHDEADTDEVSLHEESAQPNRWYLARPQGSITPQREVVDKQATYHLVLRVIIGEQVRNSAVFKIKVSFGDPEVGLPVYRKRVEYDLAGKNLFTPEEQEVSMWLRKTHTLRTSHSLRVTIDFGLNTPAPDLPETDKLGIRYIELVRCYPESIPSGQPGDTLVCAYGSPTRVLQVFDRQDSPRIHAWKISQSGTFLVTLSYTQDKHVIDLWNISASTSTKIQEFFSVPCKIASFQGKFSDGYPANRETPVNLAVCNNGIQIALLPDRRYQEPQGDFLLFQKDGSAISRRIDVGIKSSLIPYGDFHCFENSISNAQGTQNSDCFVACNGCSIVVYDSHKNSSWTPKYDIPLVRAPGQDISIPKDSFWHRILMRPRQDTSTEDHHYAEASTQDPNFDAAFYAIKSLHRGLFAWRGHPQVVSVWRLDLRKLVSYAVISEILGMPEVSASFSLDASILLVKCPARGFHATYWTESGVQIRRHTENLHSEQYLVMAPSAREPTTARNYYLSDAYSLTRCYKVRSLEAIKGEVTNIPDGDHWKQILVKVGHTMVHIMEIKNAIGQSGDSCRHRPQDILHPLKDDQVMTPNGPITTIEQPLSHGSRAVFGNISTFGSSSRNPMGAQGKQIYELRIYRDESDGIGQIVLRFAHDIDCAFFAGIASRLVVISGPFVQIWALPKLQEEGGSCSLLLCWRIKDYERTSLPKPSVCRHQDRHGRWLSLSYNGCTIKLDLLRPTAHDKKPGWFLDGIPMLVKMVVDMKRIYRADQDHMAQKLETSVVNYLNTYVNCYPMPRTPQESVMAELCRCWRSEYKVHDSNLIDSIIRKKDWVPFPNYGRYYDAKRKKRMSSNPVSILLEDRAPHAIGTTKIIYEYCIQKARETGNIGFLKAILESLPKLFERHEETAIKYIREISLIKATDTSFLLDMRQITYSPWWRLFPYFWKRLQWQVHECEHPVIQVHYSRDSSQQSPKPTLDNSDLNDIGVELYAASFDMLWRYHSPPTKTFWILSWLSGITPKWISVVCSFTWSQTCPWSHRYIRCHDFLHQCYDSPAIDALIEYKWNRMGFLYWMSRFVLQLVAYILVLVMVSIQIVCANSDTPFPLYGIAFATFLVTLAFLAIEYNSLISRPTRLLGSMYNYAGFVAFSAPCAASFGLGLAAREDTIEDDWMNALLSFSVVMMFLHMLFELRVMKRFCKVVTILTSPISGIKIFLIIFFLGILAFSVALLHLTRTYLLADGSEFPNTLHGAYFSSFLILVGRYDPLAKEFDQGKIAFMVLLFLFVFFGVIVMLNVFIALVNANYETASVEWLSVWRENRLRYVERAENMSYHITGFREYFDYFPEYIYFSPSEAEKAGFRDKYSLSYPPVDEDKVAQRHLELERLLLQLLSELKRQQQENQQEQALASESESQTQQELRQSNHTHNATDNNNGGGQGNLAANLGSWTLGATGSSSSVSAVTI